MSVITLHPGGNNMPSPTRRANILAALGAAAAVHGHEISGITGLVTALDGKIALLPAPTEPSAVGLTPSTWWLKTTDWSIYAAFEGAWIPLSGLSGGGSTDADSILAALGSLSAPQIVSLRAILAGASVALNPPPDGGGGSGGAEADSILAALGSLSAPQIVSLRAILDNAAVSLNPIP